MKISLAILTLLFALQTHSQHRPTDYLDMYLEVTSKGKAEYCRYLTPLDENLFEADITTTSGRLKAEGVYLKVEDELIPHGDFIFYHANGKVESKGRYVKGYKVDTWKRYDNTGHEKPEKYYKSDLGNLIEAVTK